MITKSDEYYKAMERRLIDRHGVTYIDHRPVFVSEIDRHDNLAGRFSDDGQFYADGLADFIVWVKNNPDKPAHISKLWYVISCPVEFNLDQEILTIFSKFSGVPKARLMRLYYERCFFGEK